MASIAEDVLLFGCACPERELHHERLSLDQDQLSSSFTTPIPLTERSTLHTTRSMLVFRVRSCFALRPITARPLLSSQALQPSHLCRSITTMTSSLSIKDTLPLPNNSNRIPQLGFGVYRSPTSVCIQSCLTALKAGYRHIDTAQFYANESEVGQAVSQSGIPRKDVYLTTKILSAGGSVDASYKKCVDSVKKLDPSSDGYVDLFLIHSPNAGSKARKEMWLALERLYEEGKAKAIGVSNWGIGHINEAKDYAKVWPPHVNQIEVCSGPSSPPSRSSLTDDSYTHGVNNATSSTSATNNKSS